LSLALFLCIFLGGFASLVYDEKFYQREIEKNRVRDSLGADADRMASRLIAYLKDGASLGPLYNDRERAHLADVKILVDKGFVLYYCLLAVLLMLAAYCWRNGTLLSDMRSAFLWTAIAIVAFSILSFTLHGLFEDGFVVFHEVLFDNDLWLLDPTTDKLIVLLPLQFFEDFVMNAYIKSLTVAFFLFVIVMLWDRMIYIGARSTRTRCIKR
jgi:integral membrane protein (TIGR01906 family)